MRKNKGFVASVRGQFQRKAFFCKTKECKASLNDCFGLTTK